MGAVPNKPINPKSCRVSCGNLDGLLAMCWPILEVQDTHKPIVKVSAGGHSVCIGVYRASGVGVFLGVRGLTRLQVQT